MTLTKELLDQLLEAAERRAVAASLSQHRIVSDLTVESADDRRQKQRIPVQARAMIVRLNRGLPQPPVEVELRDVSTHGVCILHTEPLSAGEQFALRLPREDSTPQWMHCIVVDPRPIDENHFSIGCKFTRIIQPATKAG